MQLQKSTSADFSFSFGMSLSFLFFQNNVKVVFSSRIWTTSRNTTVPAGLASRTPDEPRSGPPNAFGLLLFRDLQRPNTCKFMLRLVHPLPFAAVNATRPHRPFFFSPLPDIPDGLKVSLVVALDSVPFNFISLPNDPRSHLSTCHHYRHRAVLYAGANRRRSGCLVARGRALPSQQVI